MPRVKLLKLDGRSDYVLRWTDPLTGAQRQQTTKTGDHRKAERKRAALEVKIDAADYNDGDISWDGFKTRYWAEHLPSLADSTQGASTTAFNHVKALLNPSRLADMTPAAISRFQAKLRATGVKETTIAGVLGHLRAALGWAERVGLLGRAPKILKPRRSRGGSGKMRGRPITTEEFERLLLKVPKVRKRDAARWSFYLTGLWLSGLRLSESLLLGWDDDAPLALDFSGRHPRLRIWCEGEKGHKDRLLPLTPDFAEFLEKVPEAERVGRVFKLNGICTKKPITAKRVGRNISEIGKKAKVIVNKAEGKYASAHDLRRSFGTRWANRVKPATLQLLMRHETIATTMKYYVAMDADEIGDTLWASWQGDKTGDKTKGADNASTVTDDSKVSNA